MAMNYRWSGKIPDEKLQYSLSNYPVDGSVDVSINSKVFDAGVRFNRVEINTKNLNRLIFRYPFMTMQIALAIYFPSLKLSFKGVPFFPRPERRKVHNDKSA